MFRNSSARNRRRRATPYCWTTAPPAGNITLDGGAVYTRTRSVAVALAASDKLRRGLDGALREPGPGRRR